MEKAIFAAGCFWGVELNFSKLKGVTDTNVGYIGGSKDDPTYEEVCRKTTDHAEAVEVIFDSEIINYQDLVEKFWDFHDPTTLNRQGPDHGTQYRSAIFYITEKQKNIAEASKKNTDESGRFSAPIVTEIVPASRFWLAEEYHQKYLEKKGITIGCV